MQAPTEWTIRAAVVATPWAHPERSGRYETLLDAILNADPDGGELAPWIILEDGHMLNPRQIATLRESINRGSLALPAGLLNF